MPDNKTMLPAYKKSEDNLIAAVVKIKPIFKTLAKRLEKVDASGRAGVEGASNLHNLYATKIDEFFESILEAVPKPAYQPSGFIWDIKSFILLFGNMSELRSDVDAMWDKFSSSQEKANAKNQETAVWFDNIAKFLNNAIESGVIDNMITELDDSVKSLSTTVSKQDIEISKMVKSLLSEVEKMRATVESCTMFGNKTLKDFFKTQNLSNENKFISKCRNELQKKVGLKLAEELMKNYNSPEMLIKKYVDSVKSFKTNSPLWTVESTKKYRDSLMNIDQLLSEFAGFLKTEKEKNQKNLEKKAEAPPSALLGQIAFGEERIDDAPFENDTKFEKDLYNSLISHVTANDPLDKDDTDLIKKILKSGTYTKFFKEPDVSTVYRGMKVSSDWLRTALGLKKGEKIPNKGSKESKLVFTPNRKNASSWTSSKQEAAEFSLSSEGDGQYSIIMHASIEDNPNSFVDLRGGIYKSVYGFGNFTSEKESIGMGKIRVFNVEWKKTPY